MSLISRELRKHFAPEELDKAARDVGFIKRTGKLKAHDFVYLFVYSMINTNEKSLSSLNSKLESETKVSLSNQGLNDSINKSGIKFLKKIFISLLNKKLCSKSYIPSLIGDYFNRIRILDSTAFQLPDIYAEKYQGSGGCSHTAGLKIQLEYDLKSGDFMHINVSPGKDNDSTYGSELVKTVEEKDLCIRDLGYFCINDFAEIENRNAYYLSRLKLNVNVYKKKR